ncbi:mov34/MPN/PAD-1 family protein [Zea mays]|uniref:Mov34/MPN/PAD-1 family protein n=1 Tax=Zea mays TaxID=4577 RepID=B4FWV0_MAIZE|nr:mov34/MPN/PAD-1 family protein [Zea mays]ACF86593.1 unknown [Zea mays]AQK88126.1 Mov34/MPN/PAD-1 family protein [Zea mays]|eukprot:XP_008647903.1 mov34/MPN/PAD-1 family protein isoform X1 [Zea mays]
MSLSSVKIGEEVWLTCLSHALTTETEEVMGLLLGDIELSSKGATALIWGASPQMRCERKKDRVEVNPELLAAASAQAEKMTATIKKTTRVIGWYHSHPHITVLPSHVDVRTQAMFQLLDTGFVGLIFSCFSEDAQKVGKIQVTAFQSEGGQQHALPLAIAPVIDLDSSLSSSDNALTSHSALVEGMEQDTGDSRASKHNKAWKRSLDFYSHPDTNHSTNYQPNENTLALYNPDNTQEAPVDPYDSDMTQSLQEALHRSTMDISGAEYRGKEVPLFVLPTRYLLKLDTTMTSYCDMQRVLFEEEQSAYNQAMQQNICDGKIHPLTSIHCTSTYNSSLCKLMEYCLSPAVITLQDRLKENELRLSMLKEECKQLEADTQGMRNGSPRRLMNHGAGGSGSPMAQSRHPFSSQGSPRSPSGGSRRRA